MAKPTPPTPPDDGQSGTDFGPDLPPEELDMIVDEVLGHPQPGPTAARLAALEQRIKYLTARLAQSSSASASSSYSADLAEARRQLAALQHQQSRRN